MALGRSWKDYEAHVAVVLYTVYRQFKGLALEQVKHGKANTVAGASGFAHQVDVSVQGPHDLLLIECKYWGRRVRIEAVLAFLARVHDIRGSFRGQVHGYVVSQRGFQPGAEQIAHHYGIALTRIEDTEAFALRYTGNTLIRPRPAMVRLSTSLGEVVPGHGPPPEPEPTG